MVDSENQEFRYILINIGQVALTNGYVKFAEGVHCEVWLSKKAVKAIRKSPSKDRGRMSKILEHLSDYGPADLKDTQYKAERRLPTGGKNSKNVMVNVCKSYQLRVYGCWEDGPPRQFMCTEAIIKKTNKADIELLKRVAQRFGE